MVEKNVDEKIIYFDSKRKIANFIEEICWAWNDD